LQAGHGHIHVIRQLLQVSMLLGQLLLQLQELLLLALPNSVVLAGALSSLEGVTVKRGVLADRPCRSISTVRGLQWLDTGHRSGRVHEDGCLAASMQRSGKTIEHSPLAARLGGSSSVALAHGTDGDGESTRGAEDRGAGDFGEGGAEHGC
jgi:hypothetical protein